MIGVMSKMQLDDIFHLQNGDTIFAGKFRTEIATISKKGQYIVKLIIDGITSQENIEITGEMTGGRHPYGHRGIVTMDKVDLNSEFVKSHNCKIILVER